MIRLLWLLIVGSWPARCPDEDEHRGANLFATRCRAPVSPTCWDKRCRYHCNESCQCETADIRQLKAVR